MLLLRLLIQSAVARSALEVIVIRLDVGSKVHYLACLEHACVIEVDWFTMVIFTVIDGIEPSCPGGHAQIFPTLRGVVGGNLIFGEDRLERAFGDACAAVDARVGVDVKPRPFVSRFARDDAFHRTNIDATGIAQAQAGDNVCHL
jgi:hypothetical protein